MKKQITLVAFLFIACYGILKSQSITLQLSPSNYNNFGVSCFGGRDGSIDLTVSGGTSPYTYQWSNGEQTEDISNLPAQYFRVHVIDANNLEADGEITLTEPEGLQMEVSIYEYPNHFNISLYNACNGIATLTLYGGITPLTYLWSDGSTNQNRSNLCARNYGVVATDANGCKVSSEKIYLTEPAESHWTQTGNANSNSTTNFIGTTDTQDFVIKSNNSEGLRILTSGSIKIPSLSGSGNRVVMVDNDGKFIFYPCQPWSTCGNSLLANDFFGSTNNMDIVFKTDINSERFRISASGDIKIKKYELLPDGIFYNSAGFIEKIDFTTPSDVLCGDGQFRPLNAIGSGFWNSNGNHIYNSNSANVGIGTQTPSEKLEIAHNPGINNPGGMVLHNLNANNKNSEIKFKANNNDLWAIGCDVTHGGQQNFFIWDNASSATRLFIDADGRVGINIIPPTTSSLYKLYVEGGVATRDVKVTATDPFPDYIFNNDYQLRSIYELEQFIKHNKHLPDFPSAKEVEMNEGFEVGEMQIKLLKKIEEQTLYIIDLQKQIDELKAQMQNNERRK